jgi:hypothetical protein
MLIKKKMTKKEKYKALCTEFDLPIFMQYWWLDAVWGEDNWEPILAENKAGKIEAALTCCFFQKWGIKTIIPVYLTPFSGIWFRPQSQRLKAHSIAEKEVVISQQLIELLPDIQLIIFQTHYTFQNWLGFHWAGFRQTTRYTYVLDDLSDLERVFNNFKGVIRTNIKKAERIVTIANSEDAAGFYDFINTTLDKKGVSLYFKKNTLLRLDEALKERQCRKIFVAKDEQNNIHAAIYTIWDKQTTYLLLTGVNRQFSNSAALSLLIWEAIKEAASRSQSFDFEGSMLPKVEPFFRAFGGVRQSYYRLSKTKNYFWTLIFSLLKKI